MMNRWGKHDNYQLGVKTQRKLKGKAVTKLVSQLRTDTSDLVVGYLLTGNRGADAADLFNDLQGGPDLWPPRPVHCSQTDSVSV